MYRQRLPNTLFDGGGEMSMPRELISSNSLAMTSGEIRFCPFIAARSEAITKVRVRVGTVAAATVTLIRVGIYQVDQSGALWLVASIPNTTTMCPTPATISTTVNLSATFNKICGRLYAAAFIFVGTTAPTLLGGGGSSYANTPSLNPFDLMPFAGALKRTGQTDLVTPVLKSALALAGGALPMPLVEMIP
jgi:hypothetical protein